MFLAIIPLFLYLLVKESRGDTVRQVASGLELLRSGGVIYYFEERLRQIKVV